MGPHPQITAQKNLQLEGQQLATKGHTYIVRHVNETMHHQHFTCSIKVLDLFQHDTHISQHKDLKHQW